MRYIKEFNENKKRFFFDTDCSSHWYMIPIELKESWNLLNTSNEDDDETIDKFNEVFSEYRVGGGITNISFENPITNK